MKQLFTIFALFIGIITVNAQYIYNDFDDNQNEVVSGWPNAPVAVANPDASGINTSANVGEWVRTAEQWAHMSIELEGKIDFSTGSNFQLKGHFPIACQVLFKLEDKTNGAISTELSYDVTTTGEWIQLNFDFTDGQSETYDKIVIFFDFSTSMDNTYYLDDIEGPEYGEGTTPDPITLPVTFDDDQVNYGLIDFGGNFSEIIVDPNNSSNNIVQSIKTDAAELWAGTTVGGTLGFANPIPFLEGATTMSVAVMSPEVGTPIRLKVEDATNAEISVETEAFTTVANEWEVLEFDFSNEAEGTAALDLGNNYNKASIFFNFGTTGGEAGEQIYFWDDMEFVGNGTSINELGNTEFEVYPNPADYSINLPFESTKVKIYSATGKVVFEASTSGTTINVAELSKGVYFINAINQNGIVSHSKFVKQ